MLVMRTLGWILLIAGGIGTVASALIRSDWPMYACIVISCAGVALLLPCSRVAKKGGTVKSLKR